jgi:electron transfer flavoprotein beta subunit
LITDRKFAGSDTLATSYAIALAVKKLAPYDMIISGRQAIDGDTAQVGPQAAEKIGIPQVTYCEEVISITKKAVRIKRRLERGVETVEAPLPVLITVHGSAPACRSRNARLLLKYKHAETVTEMQEDTDDYIDLHNKRPYLNIREWTVDDLNADETWLGLSGSPTKVKKVTNVVFTAKESKVMGDSDEEIESLIVDLLDNHTIG